MESEGGTDIVPEPGPSVENAPTPTESVDAAPPQSQPSEPPAGWEPPPARPELIQMIKQSEPPAEGPGIHLES